MIDTAVFALPCKARAQQCILSGAAVQMVTQQ